MKALVFKRTLIFIKNWNFTSNLKDFFLLPFSDASHEQEKIYWIARLRWLVIAFLLILIPFGIAVGILTKFALWGYVAIFMLLLGFNMLTHWGWFKKFGRIRPKHIAYQLIFDLLTLTALLSFTGGAKNPFYILFFINILLGATLLNGLWSFVFLFLCHLSLLITQGISYFTKPNSEYFPDFFIQHLVLLIAWGVSRSLGRYISMQKEKLHQVKIYAEKIDRLRALGAMTAGFSHEFASPLNTVKLRLNREIRANPDSLNLQEMNLAVEECESVIRQMNNAQIDPRDFQFQIFYLSSATTNIIKSWAHENPIAKVQFKMKTLTDKVRLPVLNYSQALMNLLDNAFEANCDGQIIITIDHIESKIILSVENTGSSFSEDVLRRFGEPFITTKITGTGLGLYSVQLFAQSSGGKAFISNSQDGAKVEIQLPQFFEELGASC
ncbi:MAG: HAMP domain-containing sensor histidine kinase [Pseudobdellovibrio sp.]